MIRMCDYVGLKKASPTNYYISKKVVEDKQFMDKVKEDLQKQCIHIQDNE